MSSRSSQPRAKIRVPANRLRSGSYKRSKESIATARHLYPDVDIEGEARLTSLRASYTVPTPTAFLSTSLGKYQMLCRVDSFTFEQESTLKLFAISLGGDLACTDCDRVLRMPGFRNCKYDPPYLVTVTYPCDSTSNPDDFRLDIPAADAMLLPHCNPMAKALRPAHQFRTQLGLDSARTCPPRGAAMKDVVPLRVVRHRFGIASALRICKGPKQARRRALAKNPASGVESTASVRVSKA